MLKNDTKDNPLKKTYDAKSAILEHKVKAAFKGTGRNNQEYTRYK